MFVRFKDDDYSKKYPGLHKVFDIEKLNIGKYWDYRVVLAEPLGGTNIKKNELCNFNYYLLWLKQKI